ncbi:MAG: LPS-assembly protein LptD [Spirochaetaceae bacterium]|nr:LPS-assembly protein LptD [Spirochaetaceae bacterium]
MKTRALALIVFLLINNILFASSLSTLSVEDATINQLVLMASVRGLSIDGTKEELKQSILDSFKLESESLSSSQAVAAIEIGKPIESNPYILEIISAQSLLKSGNENPLIILEGSAQITFKVKAEDAPQKLSASKIIVDLANKRLSALGGVSFESTTGSNNKSFQNINGEIVSLNWGTKAIDVAGGIISTTRINSEGNEITFIASSSKLSYNSDSDSFILKDGFVSTNIDTAYSSISAEKLALLPNGDMFLKNAFISIGRVPVLYLPYFYSPGATMIGNPSLGYETSRGFFVNTTFEIFGKYPSFSKTERSSFSTLLSSSSSKQLYPTSSIYTAKKEAELTNLEKWSSKTGSFLSLMFDAYEFTPYRVESGINNSDETNAFALGVASELNLLSSSLKIDFSTMTSFTSDGDTGDLENPTAFPAFRYDGKVSLDYKSSILTLSLDIPYSSDPKAKKAYSNRLSSFNLDALWNKDQKFPTTYSSDVNSYKWDLTAKIVVPTTIFGDYIKVLQMTSINSSAEYTWQNIDSTYKYSLTSYFFPAIKAKMSGTLFSFIFGGEQDIKVDEKIKKAKEVSTLDKDPNNSLDKPIIDESTVLVDNLLIGTLDNLSFKKSSSISTKTSFTTSLDYLLNEYYSYQVSAIGENTDEWVERQNTSELDFTYKASLNPNWLSYTSKLSNTYSYDENTIINKNVTISNDNSLLLPFLGISYYFNTKLYYYNENSERKVYSSFEFTDDWVTKHLLSISHRFSLGDIYLTPKLSLQLPPLTLTLSPSLYFEGYGITNNLSFDVNVDNTFEFTSVTDTIKYVNGFFSTSLTTYYDISSYDTAVRSIDPLDLSGFITYNNTDISQKISQSFEFYGLNEDIDNYFNEIKTSYTNKFLTSEFNFSSEKGSINADYFRNTLSFKNLQKLWWKNRMGFNLSVDTTFNYDFNDHYSTYFTLKTSLSFDIAEFLECDFSITTSNYGFSNYYDSEGNFSISKLIADLGRSFDLFGEGRTNTNFNLESISFEFVHYMEDWNLHCKYTGTVVLSSYKYSFVPTLTFFLQWKTIPELKVDESISLDSKGAWQYSG